MGSSAPQSLLHSRVAVRTREIYFSANADRWLLAHDPSTGRVFVRHEPNLPSGRSSAISATSSLIVTQPRRREQSAPSAPGANPGSRVADLERRPVVAFQQEGSTAVRCCLRALRSQKGFGDGSLYCKMIIQRRTLLTTDIVLSPPVPLAAERNAKFRRAKRSPWPSSTTKSASS